MSLEDRCYVVYGNGTDFKPLKIKGYSNRNKLHRLKRKMRQNELNINCLTLYNENKVK